MSTTPPATGATGPRAWWRGLPPRTRRRLRIAFGLGAAFVLVASVVLARWLSVENAERADALALLEAQARGDVGSLIAKIHDCRQSPACVATEEANVRNPRLRRQGAVKILQLESPTAYSLSGATGRTRIAWTVIGTLPVVQCVDVRRGGNFLTGISVTMLGLSRPIENEGGC